MSNVLFLPMPGHGHVNPTLAVAAELVERGHRVGYLLPEPFRAAVEATGAEFVALDVELDDTPPPSAGAVPPFALLMGRLFAVAEAAAEPLLALHDELRPGLVVGEGMSLWGGLLAKARAANLAHLSPSYVITAMRERMQAAMPAGTPPIDTARLGAIAQRYGVAPRDAAGIMFRPAPLTVAFMPAEFHPDRESLPGSVHFVGPALGRADSAGDVPLPDGPLLYISLGTVFNDRKAFFDDCIAAFGGVEHPVVINHGARLSAADFPQAPPNITLAPHVPQLAVLARSAAFITHGGMGSTMEAIASGVPLVVVPQMIEQEITASRAAELGLGVRLDPADVTPERLAEAVRTVTTDPSYRTAVEQLGKAARAAGGAAAAADLLVAAAR
ncbi:macrolide family glycosyltransferase [Pseudonocardia sp. GCM10023141]|uniref:macrolide family glycosyltransferase n=1 Tax=Pseudonocardia sp. GCM10023141 TaxID=3252653 RepID=UPI00362353A6